MKKWNNCILLICAFLLLLICALSICGTMASHDVTEPDGNDTTIHNTHH